MTTAHLVCSTVQATLPAGIVAGKFRFSLSGQAPAEQDVDNPEASFPDLAPGDYSATCQRLDSSGTPFGPTASATFTVPTAPAMFDAPDSLTVTLS